MPDVKITEEMEKFKANALTVIEAVKKIVIKDQDNYEHQVTGLRDIKTQWSEIEGKRKELVKPLQEGVKKLNEFFNTPLTNLKRAESLIKTALVKYKDEQDEKRRKEEKEAQAKAEKQKEKLEKKAERQEANGQEEKAEETRFEAQSVPLPIVAPKVEKVKGVSFKEIWKYTIEDEKKIPRQYLLIDHKTLGSLARSAKGKVKVPGVKFYSEKSVAGSRH